MIQINKTKVIFIWTISYIHTDQDRGGGSLDPGFHPFFYAINQWSQNLNVIYLFHITGYALGTVLKVHLEL